MDSNTRFGLGAVGAICGVIIIVLAPSLAPAPFIKPAQILGIGVVLVALVAMYRIARAEKRKSQRRK